MDINLNLDHNKQKMEDCIANSPVKYEPMIRALYVMFTALIADDLKDETKKMKRKRVEFMKGVVSMLACQIDNDADFMKLSKASYLVERFVANAVNEASMIALADMVAHEILKKYPGSSKELGPQDKTAIVKLNDDGSFDESQLDGLPESVKTKVREQVAEILKSRGN